MLHKLLKIELLILFATTILAFVAFYYQGALPDNAYMITSSSESIGWPSYAFFSFVAMFGHFVGPWVFFPFIFMAMTYGFVLRSRDCAWDLSLAPFVLSVFLCTGFYLYPEFLGQGLRFLMQEYASDFALFSTLLISLAGCFVVIFRGTFFETLIYSAQRFSSFVVRLPYWLSHLRPFSRLSQSASGAKQSLLSHRVKFRDLLKGEPQAALPEQSSSERERRQEKNVSSDSGSPKEKRPIFTFNRTQEVADQGAEDRPNLKEDIPQERSRAAIKPGRSAPSARASAEHADYKKIVESFAQKQRPVESSHPDDEYFHDIINRIEEKLGDFGIDGKILNILKGPVVDTFELETGPGVKVSKINGIQDDLTMALMGAPIRIVYPMPQKTTIGIEVPRNPRDVIFLHEVLQSSDFSDSSARLPVAMGKNAFGETFVVDLASMPHMLVAGATGAGKSVFINTLLVSLLIKRSPQQMKLILIDPKQLELALYSSLPHLVMPVLTDPKKSSIALLWAVEEMERRYAILKECGVRNIEGFNKKIANAGPAMLAKIRDLYKNDPDDEGYQLPYLVIIVDEFADLILTKAGKEIENYICRLAAKARAAGVHLVLATQRPSVDVVTGLIKSNFPTRVSFRVTTNADSRTILDSVGAEKLLGKGDMLYRNGTETTRVHSSFVDEEEIEVLVDQLADMQGSFNDDAMDFLENGGPQENQDDFSFGSHLNSSLSSSGSGDDLFDQAVRVVMEQRAASASMLQRRLKIGYNRAANLIDELESKGVVGPAQGAKPRSVMSSPEADL